MEKISIETLQVFMYNMVQFRDLMKSVGLQEVAVKAQESYDVANRYLLFLEELEESTPKWMKWLMAKKGFKFRNY